jgi:hypothetical protein
MMGKVQTSNNSECHCQNYLHDKKHYYTRSVQWETGKVVLKIACTTVIVCRVCEGGDLELPINGVGTPAACIGTCRTDRQDGSALATVC